MKRIKIYLMVLLLNSGLLSAQKVPVDNTIYDGWKNLSSQIEKGKIDGYNLVNE